MKVGIRVKFASHQSIEVFGVRGMGECQATDRDIIGSLIACGARSLNLVGGLRLPCNKCELEI